MPQNWGKGRGDLLQRCSQVRQFLNPGKALHGAVGQKVGPGSCRPVAELHGAASNGLTLRGVCGAGGTVTADSHRVCIEGIHPRSTAGQLHSHLFGLIIGTDAMMGFNVRGFRNWLL